MFNSPASKITNYTHTLSTSVTLSASASKVPSSTMSSTTTSTTLCGYRINHVESPDPIDNADHVCRGCNSTASKCPNKVYHDICLHAILDYYEKVGLFFTEDGIKDAYYNAYCRCQEGYV